MDKYLLQILHEVNTIIIPGLGALTVTNHATGEIMFMSFLKHDDGNLSTYISEKEGVSENDAKNTIAKYVREIQAKLDKGESYDMYKFGSFFKKDGEIEFEWKGDSASPADASAEMPETKPEEIVEVENKVIEEVKVEEKKIEEVLEKAPEKENPVEKAKETISEILSASTIVEKTEELKKEEIKEVKETKAPVEVPKVEEKKEIPVQKIDTSKISPSENVYIPEKEVEELAKKQADEKKTAVQAKVKKVVEQKTKEAKKKKSPVFWLLMILGFLVVSGGICTVIFYDKVETILFGAKELEDNEKEKLADIEDDLEKIEEQVSLENEEAGEQEKTELEDKTTENAAEKAEEKIPVKVVEKAAVVNSGSSLPFHIIVGGFGDESNANRLAKKLQDEGKGASVLGKFDGLFLVSYSSFASKDEANSKMSSEAVKGWIFKYSK